MKVDPSHVRCDREYSVTGFSEASPRACSEPTVCIYVIFGKAKHSPTNDWDTNAVWVMYRRRIRNSPLIPKR